MLATASTKLGVLASSSFSLAADIPKLSILSLLSLDKPSTKLSFKLSTLLPVCAALTAKNSNNVSVCSNDILKLLN